MASLDNLAFRELGPLETLFVMGDSEVHTRSTIVVLVRLSEAIPFALATEALERATRLVPHLRCKVIAPVLPVSRPHWTVDANFDIGYHVRLVRVPGEGNERDLLTLVESIGSVPVDVARPLWDVTVIEGLSDGTSALVCKFHHAISDGEGAREIFGSLFQLAPEQVAPEMPPTPTSEDMTRIDLTRQRIVRLPGDLASAANTSARLMAAQGVNLLMRPGPTTKSVLGYVQSLRRTLAPRSAVGSPLLKARGLRRRYLSLTVPLSELHRSARAVHVSVNSAYVAGIVGGVARYHEACGERTSELSLAMPVSVRKPGDSPEKNHFVAAWFSAPADGVTVTERAQAIHQLVRAAREEPALEAITALAPVMSRFPLWITTSLAGGLASADCQISNLIGYPVPVYLGTAQVVGLHAFGPLAGAAMMVVMTSADGQCHIGLNLDADAVLQPDLLLSCVEDAFEELLQLGRDEDHGSTTSE